MPEKDTIEFEASDELVALYRGLLRDGDWSLKTLKRSLDAFYEVVEAAKVTVQFPWEAPRKKQRGEYPIPPGTSEDVRRWLELMNDREAEEASRREVEERTKWTEEARLVARAEFALVAELALRRAKLKVAGDLGFFHDLQSLIFQTAVLHLLPTLSNGDASSLVDASWGYCHVTWRRDPTHAEMLRALLAEELGKTELAEESLRNAIAQTPPSSHDYLTKVQILWSLLIDQERTNDALDLLWRVHREASPEIEAELSELMRQTVHSEPRERGRSKRKD